MTRTRVGDRDRINFYFDKQVLEALKKLAALKNTTYSELIRVAVRKYVVEEGMRAIADGTIIKEVRR
jgi:metal-responsive CopG/Arc/MetJ family transcriptional regulator